MITCLDSSVVFCFFFPQPQGNRHCDKTRYLLPFVFRLDAFFFFGLLFLPALAFLFAGLALFLAPALTIMNSSGNSSILSSGTL
jgi:hypothetical protein